LILMLPHERARAVPDLLREWAGWAERRRTGLRIPLPTVTLHLRSGRDLRGIVLHLAEHGVELHVVLGLLGEGERMPPSECSHVPVEAIEAVTVHGFGKEEPVEDAPSMFQFRRTMAEWQKTLESEFGAPIGIIGDWPAEDLGPLETLRRSLASLLHGLAAQPDFRNSFAGSVRQIELAVASKPSVDLVAGSLRVVTTAPVANRMCSNELKDAIEAML